MSEPVSPSSKFLEPRELFWAKLQPYLLERGYRLRPRYAPDWKPSRRRLWSSKNSSLDSLTLRRYKIIDAVRVRDGMRVVLKKVYADEDIPILEYLNSPELVAEPRNHTIPLLDVIKLPQTEEFALIVMPMLLDFHPLHIPFRFVSEVLEALEQFIEGLIFMHEHHIAHRDACSLNLAMEATKIIPRGFHFVLETNQEDGKTPIKWNERRSVSPVKYFFIDFETACRFLPGENLRCTGRFGQEKGVPEMSETVPYDPFKLDVYQLGKIIPDLLFDYEGLDFLRPLHDAMTHYNPEKRLTAVESYQMLQNTMSQLAEADKSRRIWRRDMPYSDRRLIEFPPEQSKRKPIARLRSFMSK